MNDKMPIHTTAAAARGKINWPLKHEISRRATASRMQVIKWASELQFDKSERYSTCKIIK